MVVVMEDLDSEILTEATDMAMEDMVVTEILMVEVMGAVLVGAPPSPYYKVGRC